MQLKKATPNRNDEMSENSQLAKIDTMELLQLLPHRYPFLLIDKVIEVDGNESGIGIKNVTFNEEFFIGHFPGKPIMPGVLIIEALAQTAGAISAKADAGGERKLVYLMSVDGVKFRKMVVPGDVLHLHVKKIKQRREIYKFQSTAWVEGEKVAEAVITAMIAAPESEA